MHLWQIGDQVEVLDEKLTGIIKEIGKTQILVHTSDGFDIHFNPEELVLLTQKDSFGIGRDAVKNALKEKEAFKRKSAKRIKPKERNAPTMVIDLHIHKIVPETKGLNNYDILNIQIDTAKRQLDFAIAKRIPKIVFIHGVGEGVLKEELYYLFRRYEQLRYYDADYQKYGLGATEIHITQN